MPRRSRLPELVAPAGDWSALSSALSAGADSVYFGLKGFNLRNFAVNFDILELKKIIATLHRHKKRGYLALNVIAYDSETGKIKKILKEAKLAGVDGVILWDLGVFSLAKALGLKIHLSTQASVSNLLSLKQYHSLGASRAVLARECRLSDIRRIVAGLKKENIACKVEVFVHGAMCISISGRCLLSADAFSQSANRGECLQPCRREYSIYDKEKECEYRLGRDYVLSPKDLCTISFIDRLIEAGIDAFKIEGRMRSPEYVRVVTAVYREAIEAFSSVKLDEKYKKELEDKLKTVYNRGFSSGFYHGEPEEAVSRTLENRYEKVYLGEVTKFYKKIGVAEIRVRNQRLVKGDKLLCFGKHTPASFAVVQDIQINHEFVERLERGATGGVKLPFIARRNDKVFIWKEKPLQ